ncbi:MAG: hypothetical protein AAGA81_24165 [Acidobacteriota bacterium]
MIRSNVRPTKICAAVALAALWLANAASAQQEQGWESLEPRDRVVRANLLFQQVLARIISDDPGLRATLSAYQRAVDRASDGLDPRAAALRERLASMGSRYGALLAEGRSEEARALVREALELRGQLEEIAARARQSGDAQLLAQSLLRHMRELWGDLEPLDPMIAKLAADDEALLRIVSLLGSRERSIELGGRQ